MYISEYAWGWRLSEVSSSWSYGPSAVRVRWYVFLDGWLGHCIARREGGKPACEARQGEHWLLSHITYPEDLYREVAANDPIYGTLDLSESISCYSWCFWTFTCPISKLKTTSVIMVRAMDSAMNSTPRFACVIFDYTRRGVRLVWKPEVFARHDQTHQRHLASRQRSAAVHDFFSRNADMRSVLSGPSKSTACAMSSAHG